MLGLIVRFIVSALVLMLVSFVLPGFAVFSFTGAILAAVVIAVLGFIAENVLGKKASPQNRGILSFIISAIVIYVAQFVVADMSVSVIGAALAAIIIGIIDSFVPTELR